MCGQANATMWGIEAWHFFNLKMQPLDSTKISPTIEKK